MLKLNRRTEDTFWLDLLPGVRVRMKRVTVAMTMLARRAALAGIARPEPEGEQALGALTDEQNAAVSVGIVSSLVKQGLVEWEGVADADGNPVPVSSQAVEDLLDIVPAFDAFDRLYYSPAFTVEAEKNG